MRTTPNYFDPDTIAKLRGLPLRARHIVEGYITGLHRSPHQGSSVEFVEHREYSPGDDLRYVDWKVYAKSDRYYVKRFQEETNLICHLLVDTSESMSYQGPRAAMSKLEYAKCLAATLAYLVLAQQDSVGITTYSTKVEQDTSPSNQPSSWRSLMHLLQEAEATGKTASARVFHELAERWKKRSLVLIFSDLFDTPEDVLQGIRHLRYRQHDVAVFHILDQEEVEFSMDTTAVFSGMEGMPKVTVNPHQLRKAYIEEFRQYEKKLRHGCSVNKVDYHRVLTSNRFDHILRPFLMSRYSGSS